MKAALLRAPRQIEIEETVEPVAREREVVIEPVRAGVCGSDVSFYLGHRTGDYPLILGHELIGRVVATGGRVTRFQVGQRVTVEPNFPCGACAFCLAGRGCICPNKLSMGLNVPGCFAQRVAAPEEFVWVLPDAISDEDGACIEPMAVSVHALRQSGARAGDTVAVVGCGVVGLLLVHAAAEEGVRVLAHDRFAEKEERARELGALSHSDTDVAAIWRQENVTTVFECAGATESVELALEAAPRGAKVVLLGLSSAPARFTPLRVVREGIRIEPSLIYDHPGDFSRTIELVASGRLRPSRIVTGTFPLESVAEAIQLAASGKAGKVHLTYR
jgi:2-desacetyl-2-hydroxyethyl bacteriochlorophyllide A dehydrogenase